MFWGATSQSHYSIKRWSVRVFIFAINHRRVFKKGRERLLRWDMQWRTILDISLTIDVGRSDEARVFVRFVICWKKNDITRNILILAHLDDISCLIWKRITDSTRTSFHCLSTQQLSSVLQIVARRLLHSLSLFLRFASIIPIWTASAPIIVSSDGKLLGSPFVKLIDGIHCRIDTTKKKTLANFCFGLKTSHR